MHAGQDVVWSAAWHPPHSPALSALQVAKVPLAACVREARGQPSWSSVFSSEKWDLMPHTKLLECNVGHGDYGLVITAVSSAEGSVWRKRALCLILLLFFFFGTRT